MEPSKGRQQHYLKNCKPSTFHYNHQHENNSYSMSSTHGIFKNSKIQRHSLKWRKDNYLTGNFRSRFQYRKNDFSGRRSFKSAEDVEEEERKKKLTDTAKQLLSKIKTWNAEKNHGEDVTQPNCSVIPVVSETTCKQTEEKVSTENKPKRIAHSKKARMLKNGTAKSFSLPQKMTTRYDVNKETVKNFQNRIQHKLIEEIMQMPKENLQNVLNDPKINPIMELKMSRLVRENKLLIAQKLRALAESKMKSPGCSTSPQLLVDYDKLIDPVIETDLSVLPFELIKQMENVFQVQFDYIPGKTDSQLDSGYNNSVADSVVLVEDESVKVELKEDVSVYECSTDEDEEINCSSRPIGSIEEFRSTKSEISEMEEAIERVSDINCARQKHSSAFELEDNNSVFTNVSAYTSAENEIQVKNSFKTSKVSVSSQCVPEELLPNSLKTFISTSCQTDCYFESESTEIHSSVVETLCSASLPRAASHENISALLDEVNRIQNLTNKLNERRLMIFLQLAKLSPTGSFISDSVTQRNFIESITSGNLTLVESLKEFFTNRQRRRSKGKKRKFTDKNTNKTR